MQAAHADAMFFVSEARALQADAVRTHPLLAWVVMRDEAEYPGEFVGAW